MSNEIAKNEKAKRKGKKRKIIISVIAAVLVICVAVGGIFIYKNKSSSQTYSFVRTTTLSKGTLDDSISTTGTVISSKTSNVTTSLQYTVKSIEVKVGDEVKKGDVIATLDTTQLEKQIKSAKENIEKQEKSAKISYNSAKQAYSDAKSEYESAKSTVASTKAALEKAKSSKNSNDAQSQESSAYDKAKEAFESSSLACSS